MRHVCNGIRETGHHEILGFYTNPMENHAAYRTVPFDLIWRVVEEPPLFVADGLPDIEEETRQFYPKANFQLCSVHASRNIELKIRITDMNVIDLYLK